MIYFLIKWLFVMDDLNIFNNWLLVYCKTKYKYLSHYNIIKFILFEPIYYVICIGVFHSLLFLAILYTYFY